MERAVAITGWDNFYVIVGSSAAALTGLQFVVVTLVSADEKRKNAGAVGAFGTPTVVHFCSVLVLAAIVSAPWRLAASVAMAVGICGALGLVYATIVTRRVHRTRRYQPVLEDWIFHTVLPALAYGSLLVAAARLPGHPAGSMFTIAAATLLLLLIGIHNAWDAITWVGIDDRKDKA